MAIVKMSEFEMLVRNDQLDHLLVSLQRYGNVMFDQKVEEIGNFKHITRSFDRESNTAKQEHIQSILKRLSSIKKQEGPKKGQMFDKLNLQTMTYDEMESIVKETDLDSILNMYAEFYESESHFVESFKMHMPWEVETFTSDALLSLDGVRPIIGKVPSKYTHRLVHELEGLEDVYFMYQPDTMDESIFVIIPTPKRRENVEVLIEKYEMESRSSVSLHIEDKVVMMRYFLSQMIDKRLNIGDRLSRIGLYQEILKAHYESLRNEALRESMCENFIASEHVTYLKGWIMTDQVAEFSSIVNEATDGVFDLEIIAAPLHSPDIPIKLKNNRFARAFEPITNMYSQPRYDELDPTPIFAPFYAFFFGMMLADVGYGLIMGVVMFAALKLLNLKPSTRDMLRLLLYVSVPTMFWGIIYGSFFGGMIPLTPIIDINNQFNHVLVMALGFGIIHLFVGLGVKGYIYFRDYKKRYIIYDVLFWYMTLIGIIVLVSQMFTDFLSPYASSATIIMIIGMVGIVLTNGREAKTVFGKGASGLYSLYGITNYIGDVVSYSRLMALGLAGASIGVAFNMMVSMAAEMGTLGVIFGAVVFIFGHTFNLLISGLSSYVHAARLTYVEFFGKFFVGGGRAFEPFIAAPTYIELERE
ncbi:V-type ATP synthase subunit I [Erysipelothrix sp. HDW6C]|uniref:V-type ATP synthase subunit I n=1 Tax=Erysipelothrix sp. HDW6C TaxID=2714930 RepID=UPI00140DB8D2|nr:V-type ATP synthase subunit I [Erysipelothrix sp. HDW6C]QIK69848.1 V-type ATP synthase subunit I [Erysipelothrix sp. HDW6C]